MHPSFFLALVTAALAFATPLKKKAVIWHTVIEYSYVTVYVPVVAPNTATSMVTETRASVVEMETPVVEVEPETEPEAEPEPEVMPETEPEKPVEEIPIDTNSNFVDPVVARALSGHNTVRPAHSARALTWNQTLARSALEETSCSEFAHILSKGADWGQNIYAAFSTSPEGFTSEIAMRDAAQVWADEVTLFNSWRVASPRINDAWLHFTQMVWIASESMGCAVRTCGTDNTIKPDWYVWYVTCNYFPVGNVLGAFDKNVKQF